MKLTAWDRVRIAREMDRPTSRRLPPFLPPESDKSPYACNLNRSPQ